MDVDTAKSVAGVVRLLRRSAELAWAQADAHGPGSAGQVFALSIGLAGDEVRNMLDDDVPLDGPVPVGGNPAGLLRSADQLLRRIGLAGAPSDLYRLRTQVTELAWEAYTGAGA